MILENVDIKIRNYVQVNYYKKKGFNFKLEDIININPIILPKNSHVKIKVKCDICGNEKYLTYQRYNKNIYKYNIYTCSNKCATIKNKKTNLEKFGVENYAKTNESNEKVKQTCMKKYGKEFFPQTKEYLEKTKEKNLEKMIVNIISKVMNLK